MVLKALAQTGVDLRRVEEDEDQHQNTGGRRAVYCESCRGNCPYSIDASCANCTNKEHPPTWEPRREYGDGDRVDEAPACAAEDEDLYRSVVRDTYQPQDLGRVVG